MRRAEFSAKTKEAAWERCGGRCEICTAPLVTGNINYDHIIPCYFVADASLDNCQVSCRSCHGIKTRERDIPRIRKSRRVRKRHLGIRKSKRRGFWRWHRFDGSIVVKT